jgi:nucleoside-diphosphate-sugar epimerase
VILVSGGTGFVGRHLVDALHARGEAVRVLSRSASLPPGWRDVELAHGDLADPSSLDRALVGVDTVVHLAARLPAPGDDPDRLFALNVQGTAALASAARSAGVARFLHVSSGGVYGDGATGAPHRETDPPNPGNAYERSKLAAEDALRDALAGSTLTHAILRPAGIYGAGRPATAAFLDEVRHRRLWLHVTPHVIVHPTHVSDVVQGCLRALEAHDLRDAVINLAGERALPLQEFVALAASTLGVGTRQLVLPTVVGIPVGRAVGAAFTVVGRRAPDPVRRAARRYVNRSLDISRARERLGFDPIPLAEGLRATVQTLAAAPHRRTRAKS